MESAARPRTHIDAPEDRAEGEAPDDPQMHFSADPDARWVKKGSKSTLGYKAFARTDEEGFVDKVHTTPANQAESPQFGTMIDGANAQRVLADKAYASKANRASLRGKHRDGIMRKAARNRPLRASEKRFNKLISKRRFRVEQCFGTMKRLFGLHRARYFGVSMLSARTKARTAASIKADSGAIPAHVAPLIAAATQDQVTGLDGGLPIFVKGILVGAIGVGSGSPQQDIAVGNAAIAALDALVGTSES